MKTRVTRGAMLLLILGAMALLSRGTAQAAPAAQASAWQPIIAVVWPHDAAGRAAPVDRGAFVNVSLWPTQAVSCSQVPNDLDLYVARGNQPAYRVGPSPSLRLQDRDGVRFPSLEFEDIPVTLNERGQVEMRFFAVEKSSGHFSNAWVHAEDGRTYQPQPLTSRRLAPNYLGLHIQTVFPHDGQGNPAPVEQAAATNVTAEVLEADRDGNWLPFEVEAGSEVPLALIVFVENEAAVGFDQSPTVRSVERGGSRVSLFDFNDVPLDGRVRTHLMVGGPSIDPVIPATIWSHAADARTNYPSPALPPPCVEVGT